MDGGVEAFLEERHTNFKVHVFFPFGFLITVRVLGRVLVLAYPNRRLCSEAMVKTGAAEATVLVDVAAKNKLQNKKIQLFLSFCLINYVSKVTHFNMYEYA